MLLFLLIPICTRDFEQNMISHYKNDSKADARKTVVA